MDWSNRCVESDVTRENTTSRVLFVKSLFDGPGERVCMLECSICTSSGRSPALLLILYVYIV